MKTYNEQQGYSQFIRYCITSEMQALPDMSGIDWRGIFNFAEQQSILGVAYEGVKRLGEHGVKPPFEILMGWVAIAEQIEGRNRKLNKTVKTLVSKLETDGYDSCILKGQGNAAMYPNPMSRTSGDIDVWMRSADGRHKEDDVRRIIQYARENKRKTRAIYHHVDYGDYEKIEVEMHYRPSFMFNPIHNSRLQKWFRYNADEQFQHVEELPEGVGVIAVPTAEFNIIFQLSHIYNHLLHEGIGLRQVIDYYYLLKSNTNRTDNTKICDTLRYLGLKKIAGAMMWVQYEKLGLEEEYLIAPMDEKRGKYVLNEILRGGNFGYYDENNKKADSPFKKNIRRLKRDIRLMRYFPSECLWEPIFRVFHYFWRVRYN